MIRSCLHICFAKHFIQACVFSACHEVGNWQVCCALMNGDFRQSGGTEEPMVAQAAALGPGWVLAPVEKGPVPASALWRKLWEPDIRLGFTRCHGCPCFSELRPEPPASQASGTPGPKLDWGIHFGRQTCNFRSCPVPFGRKLRFP